MRLSAHLSSSLHFCEVNNSAYIPDRQRGRPRTGALMTGTGRARVPSAHQNPMRCFAVCGAASIRAPSRMIELVQPDLFEYLDVLSPQLWRRTGTDPVSAWPRLCANNGTKYRQQAKAPRRGVPEVGTAIHDVITATDGLLVAEVAASVKGAKEAISNIIDETKSAVSGALAPAPPPPPTPKPPPPPL